MQIANNGERNWAETGKFCQTAEYGKSIAHYKIGRNGSIDAIIPFICQESKVNGAWLRTGNIDMMKAYF